MKKLSIFLLSSLLLFLTSSAIAVNFDDSDLRCAIIDNVLPSGSNLNNDQIDGNKFLVNDMDLYTDMDYAHTTPITRTEQVNVRVS